MYLLFGQKIPENCMKMKEFGPRGGLASLTPSLDPSMEIVKLLVRWRCAPLIQYCFTAADKHKAKYPVGEPDVFACVRGFVLHNDCILGNSHLHRNVLEQVGFVYCPRV